jgi:hypothetical protein
MTARMDLDRRLARWFADEAPDRAPDHLLEDALRVVELTTQRPAGRGGPLAGVIAAWRGLTPTRRLVLTTIFIAATFAAGAAAALLLRPPDASGPGLVLVRYQDAGDPAAGVVILEHRAATTRELLRLDAGALGGVWDGRTASLGPTGLIALGLGVGAVADGQVVIVDLRGDATPRRLDSSGGGWSWAPDGRRIATDDAGILVFDVGTGEFFRTPVEWSLVRTGGSLVWASDGSGFISDPGIETIGVVRLDGTFVAGRAPRFDPGVGPRRIRGDGTVLRCHATLDDQCGPDDRSLVAIGGSAAQVWTIDDLPVAIADYAWTAEGGIWVLTQTTAPGPRTVSLLRVEPDGTESVTASFTAGSVDPDPAGFCSAARFEAMTRDDTRLVIRTTGDGCAEGGMFVMDVATLDMIAIEGTVAGWLAPSDLERPRQSLRPDLAAPSAILGYWGRALKGHGSEFVSEPQWLSIMPSRARIDMGSGPLHDFSLSAIGGEALRFTTPLNDSLECPTGPSATYEWRVDGSGLTLFASDEACADRRALLEGTFERALPFGSGSTVTVEEGQTYLVPPFALRFTVPTVGGTIVAERDESSIGLRTDTGRGYWVLEQAEHESPGDGLTGAMAAVEVAFDVPVWTPTTVAGAPAVTGTLDSRSDSRPQTSLWLGDMRSGSVLPDGARVTLFEGPRGIVYSIVAWTADGATTDASAWADSLSASIAFASD